jgi:hypothetical protein
VANPAGESTGEILKLDFDRKLILQFAVRPSPPTPDCLPTGNSTLRVIKSSKLNRQPQPKIKSGKIAKAEKNNYSNFAAAVVLAVAGALLALSLSHLAAGVALVTRAGSTDGWLA